MHNHEKGSHRQNASLLKRSCWRFDQLGKTRIVYGFSSPFARTDHGHPCLHNNGCHLKPPEREFVSDIVRCQATGRHPTLPDWVARDLCQIERARA
jgi:hypothetical protein